MRGYGEPTVGPVGNTPLSKLLSPAPAFQLTEVANNLKGALPQSSTLSINPENWYFVK